MALVLIAGHPVEYADEGCEYSATCLDCPMTKCKYDYGHSSVGKMLRDTDILRQYDNGKECSELARLFGLSVRTIQRVIADGGRNA